MLNLTSCRVGHALVTCVALALAIPECGAAQPIHAAGGAPDDSAVVAAVLERVASTYKNVPLHFDPRPLRAEPEIVSTSGYTVLPLAGPSHAEIARRAGAGARLGFREGDIRAYTGCPGILAAGPPDLRGDRKPPAGCPCTDVVYLILAAPRVGGAYMPNGGADYRSTAPQGAWTVRMIVRRLTEWGGSSSAVDVVLTRNAAGVWSVAQFIPLFIEE